MSTCWGVKVVQTSRLAPATGMVVKGARAGTVDRQQVGLRRTVGEDAVEGEEEFRGGGVVAALDEVAEGGRARRHVVDDHIHAGGEAAADLAQVVPRAQPRVRRGVVDGVEARVGAVVGGEEGEEVDAGHGIAEDSRDGVGASRQGAAEPVCVGDELDSVVEGGGSVADDALERRSGPWPKVCSDLWPHCAVDHQHPDRQFRTAGSGDVDFVAAPVPPGLLRFQPCGRATSG